MCAPQTQDLPEQESSHPSSTAFPDSLVSVDYICKGKLLVGCGLERGDVEAKFSEWLADGAFVAGNLGFDGTTLTECQAKRIYHYYLPVYYWVLQQLDAKSRDRSDINPVRRPLVVRLQRNTVRPVKVFSFHFYLSLGYFVSVHTYFLIMTMNKFQGDLSDV